MLIPVRHSILARILAAGLFLLTAACIPETPIQPTLVSPETPIPSNTVPPPTFTAPPATLTLIPPTDTPLPTLSVTPTQPPTATATLPPTPTIEPVGPYAVVRVEPNDTLNVRSGPGISNPILTSLAYDAHNVMLTTRSQVVSGSLWVEILLGDGSAGWVNDYYLTRYSKPTIFCGDTRMQAMLDKFETALISQDGALLAQVVSQRHGLDVMAYRTGNSVYFAPDQIAGLFTNPTVYNWGPNPASALDEEGPFSQEILSDLSAVLSAAYTLTCDEPGPGISNYPGAWPARYTNLNYLALFKPGTPGIDLDWFGWLIGVEYVDSQPYITALIGFFWEP